VSIAYFDEFTDQAVITTVPAAIGVDARYPPVVAGDYIRDKVRAVSVGNSNTT